MAFRYSPLKRTLISLYRKLVPMPVSPYTLGKTADICAIHLVPPAQLERFFRRAIKHLRAIKGPDIGDYLEFGVFNGSSLASMYRACKKEQVTQTRFFGFDAFEGLPKESENEDDGVWKGFYTCSFEDMKTCLSRNGINANEITFVKGWYNNTLKPKTMREHEITHASIIFVDCDTYSSAKSVLDFVQPLLNDIAIICFDDWALYDLDLKEMGEYRAFNEFLEANLDITATPIRSYNRKSRSFLLRPNMHKT